MKYDHAIAILEREVVSRRHVIDINSTESRTSERAVKEADDIEGAIGTLRWVREEGRNQAIDNKAMTPMPWPNAHTLITPERRKELGE